MWFGKKRLKILSEYEQDKQDLVNDIRSYDGVGHAYIRDIYALEGYQDDDIKITVFRNNSIIDPQEIEQRCNQFMCKYAEKIDLEIIRCKAKMIGE